MKRFLAIAAIVLSTLLGVFLVGRKSKSDAQKVEKLQDAIEMQERIADVETNTTRDAALERLHENSQLRD